MHLYFTQMDLPGADVCAQLEEKGWQVHHLPFRRVHFLEAGLTQQELDSLDALIITSKQAARWLLGQCEKGLSLGDVGLAVVGKATASLLPRGNLVFEVAPANAAELVAQVRARFPFDSRFLFLRGEVAGDTVSQGLTNYQLTQKIVYETLKISENNRLLQHPAMVYFQAPGTVTDFQVEFRQKPDRIGAIGPSTATALQRAGWSIDFQPTRPESRCFARECPPSETWE